MTQTSINVQSSSDGFVAMVRTYNEDYSVSGKTALMTLKKTLVQVVADLDKATKMQDKILHVLTNKPLPRYIRNPLVEKVTVKSASVKVYALNKAYTGKNRNLEGAYQEVITQILKDLGKMNLKLEDIKYKMSFY